jgi:hypothetical protein
MTRRKKKGEFLLVCAIGSLLLGLGTGYMAIDVGARMNELRQHGVVSAAEIMDKQAREERETKVIGGGRRVSQHTTDYTLGLRFDKHAATLHKDYVAGKPLETKGSPLLYPASIDVSRAVFDAHRTGDFIEVTFLPDIAPYDKDSFQLTETVEEQSSLAFLVRWYLGALAGLALGLWGIIRYRQLNRQHG